MKTFRKVLVSVACFLVILAAMSVFLIVPFLRAENNITQGKKLRAELAGELDFFVSGASHALTAFDSKIIDEQLGCNSFNLSNTLMSTYGRKVMLEKELERNDVKTVVIEISYNTMEVNQSDAASEGDHVTMARLDTFGERISYLCKYVPLSEWVNIYSRDLDGGVSHWISRVLGKSEKDISDPHKGYQSRPAVDCTLSAEEAVEKYNESRVPAPSEYLQSNIDDIVESIELCKSKDIRVIIAVTPVADYYVWTHDGWDEFRQWTQAFAQEHGCEFYDFNLLKDRYELFNDSQSFYDGTHMSAEGSELFSNLFCEIVSKAAAGEDVSSYFVDSYLDIKQESPYAAYLT